MLTRVLVVFIDQTFDDTSTLQLDVSSPLHIKD